MSDIQWKYAKNPHSGFVESIEDANKLRTSNRYKPAYICLDCDRPMIPKKGTKKRHHFAHKSDEESDNCKGEGARHWTAKINLSKFLETKKQFEKFTITNVSVEKRDYSGLIADLKLTIKTQRENSQHVNIEIVDTNPPSERKNAEFAGKMIVFEIKNYGDEEINENYFLPDFVRKLEEFVNNSFKNRRNSKKSNCISKNRNGEPCKAPPIRGTTHCMFHTKKYQKEAYVTRSG